MPVKSYVLGPGTLELGEAPLNVSAQVRSMVVRVSERVTRVEAIPVLSGEELAGAEDVDHDAVLVGNVIQDLSADGMVDYTWANRGVAVPVRFVPSTAEGRECTGVVVLVPLEFGGDVDKTKRPEAPVSWRFSEFPELGTVVTP